MDNPGYWLFLLIIYLLSTMMKKRRQKEARKGLNQEGENDWKTPGFVKEIFTDFVDKGESDLDEVTYTELDEELEAELDENEFEGQPQISTSEPKVDFSVVQGDRTIGTLDHRTIGTLDHKVSKKKKHHRAIFFKDLQDVRMAMIYKEIMDKPRALRHSIR